MSNITQNNFYAAYGYISDMYGINISEDMFETIGYVAWRKIGNRNTKTYKQQLIPEKSNGIGWFVELPCNLEILEAVTANYEDYQKTSSITNYPGVTSSPTENFIEYMKFGTNLNYISGKLVKYERVGNNIYFTENYPIVNILYKGIYSDESGLPYINDKEVHAIATYCAFTEMYKKAIQTKDQSTFQLAQSLKADWMKACSQAKVAEYLNQNEMDEILNANSNWNRKMYNKSFKPTQ